MCVGMRVGRIADIQKHYGLHSRPPYRPFVFAARIYRGNHLPPFLYIVAAENFLVEESKGEFEGEGEVDERNAGRKEKGSGRERPLKARKFRSAIALSDFSDPPCPPSS